MKKTDHACELICENCSLEFFSKDWKCPECGSEDVELISEHERRRENAVH